jgi:hypothetical protein
MLHRHTDSATISSDGICPDRTEGRGEATHHHATISHMADVYEPGWAEITDVEGWTPDFQVFVKAALVEGVIRIVGLAVVPRVAGESLSSKGGWIAPFKDYSWEKEDPAYPGADKWNSPLAEHILTGERLRKLPIADLAAHFVHRVPEEFRGDNVVPDDGRSGVTTAEAVASVYNAAGGVTPRRHVEETLGISARTAARYIAEARRKGLIPPANPRNNLRKDTTGSDD